MKTVRLSIDQRRSMILSKAVEMANNEGLLKVSLLNVSMRYGFAFSTVRYCFNRNADLWRAIVSHPSAYQTVREEGRSINAR